MQLADKLQIVVQHLAERTALLLCLSVDHRQVQRYRTNVPAADKYRLVALISGLHAAALVPRRQERAAAHRTDDRAVLLIHARHIAFTSQRQPVRIHCVGRTLNSGIKYILERLSRTVQVLIVQEYDFREQYWLFMSFSPLSIAPHIQHCNRSQTCKPTSPCAKCHGNKGIIASR